MHLVRNLGIRYVKKEGTQASGCTFLLDFPTRKETDSSIDNAHITLIFLRAHRPRIIAMLLEIGVEPVEIEISDTFHRDI